MPLYRCFSSCLYSYQSGTIPGERLWNLTSIWRNWSLFSNISPSLERFVFRCLCFGLSMIQRLFILSSNKARPSPNHSIVKMSLIHTWRIFLERNSISINNQKPAVILLLQSVFIVSELICVVFAQQKSYCISYCYPGIYANVGAPNLPQMALIWNAYFDGYS